MPRYYVDNDLCIGDACPISVWIYEESNGRPGLQRGDEVVNDLQGCEYVGDHTWMDQDGRLIRPDTIIF